MSLVIVLMFQIVTFVYGGDASSYNKCISRGSSPLLIEDLRANSSKDDSFYNAYINRFQFACSSCSNSSIVEMAKNLKDTVEPKIKRQCVEQSMSKLHYITNRSRMLCSSNKGKATFRKTIDGKNDFCINNEVVDYVHWSVNEALTCINSLTDNPVSPEITFMKLNRESKFGFFIQYWGGIGIGQLTTSAINGINNRGKAIIDTAKNSTECKSFHELLNYNMDYAKVKNDKGEDIDVVRWCQLVNYGEGLGRNLFYSLALMLHHRDNKSFGVGTRLRRLGINDEEKINYFTLVSYGRNGLVQAAEIIDKMTYRIGVKKNNKLKDNQKLAKQIGAKEIQAMPMKEFIALLRKESEYVNENFKSLEDFYIAHNYASKNKAADKVFEESICVSQ